MMQHDNKPGLKKSPIQWSRQVDFQAGQVTLKLTWFVQLQTTNLKDFSRMFQRQITVFKD